MGPHYAFTPFRPADRLDLIAQAAERLNSSSERTDRARELLKKARERLILTRSEMADAKASEETNLPTADDPMKPGETSC